MTVRPLREEDLAQAAALFTSAVYGARAFYAREQLDAWASADAASWTRRLLQNDARAAEEDGELAGFADMTEDGYLDMLYVREESFRRGIGSALCDALESACAAPRFCVYASAMAKPFFEKRGYACVRACTAVRRGVSIPNYYMEKANPSAGAAGEIRFGRAMRARHSVRRYEDAPIPAAVLAQLEREIAACNAEGDLHIRLFAEEPAAFGGLMGRYGKFSGVKNYIALFGKTAKDLHERAGYYGERLVLLAQEAGLNTCWVALTVSKRRVKKLFCPARGEKLACVIAFGYGKTQGVPHRGKNFAQVTAFRGAAAEKEPPAWFLRGTEYALLAPTALNQQKFRFTLTDDNKVRDERTGGFYADIDLGIAKLHFELAAGKENFAWET